MNSSQLQNNRISFSVLASGSSGNSVFVTDSSTRILFDAGLSGKEIEKRLLAIGEDPKRLSAIVVSHEHTDHIKGVGVLSRRYKIPVFATKKTMSASEATIKNPHEKKFFNPGTSFCIGEIKVNPFSVSHDACDPCGFSIVRGDSKLGIATDLGIATTLVKTRLKNCNGLVLEANHDPELLACGPYPWSLKQRIKSRSGHLSNQEARDLLGEILHPCLEKIILGHLSNENNNPQKAIDTVTQALKDSKSELLNARQDIPTQLFHL